MIKLIIKRITINIDHQVEETNGRERNINRLPAGFEFDTEETLLNKLEVAS